MVLKYAYGPAIMAGLPIYFTLQFSGITKSRFMRCYEDSGLIQTCELDGWDRSKRTSKEIREEFRKWLTDCHKASFVPICLAGIDNLITVEPSKVVPTERDEDDKERFRDPLIAPMNHVQRGERISFSPTKQPSLIPSI